MACISNPNFHDVARVNASAITVNSQIPGDTFGALTLDVGVCPAGAGDLTIHFKPGDPSYAHGLARAITEFNARYEAERAAARQAAE